METGKHADDRRLNVLLRPDGTVAVPARLARWVLSLLRADLESRRREGGLAYDVLSLLDALSCAPQELAVSGNAVIQIDRIALGDASGESSSVMDALASTREAADELGCSVRTVRWMLAHHRLLGRKSGRAWLVSRSSMSEYMHGKAA